MSKLKVKTEGKYLALRTISSTLVGEGLDTLIFIPIVFIDSLDLQTMIFLMSNTFILKVFLEIILTPITFRVINFIKKKEKIDTYDNGIKYRIL